MAKKSKIPFGDPEYRVDNDVVLLPRALGDLCPDDEPIPTEEFLEEFPAEFIEEPAEVPRPTPILCDSCHTPITAYRFHFSAPQTPLCFVCYDIVNRRHTRAIQTPVTK